MAVSRWLKYVGLTGEPQPVHCSRFELMVIPWLGFALEPMCLSCYALQEKRVGYQLPPSIPLNHGLGNWRALTAPAFLLCGWAWCGRRQGGTGLKSGRC